MQGVTNSKQWVTFGKLMKSIETKVNRPLTDENDLKQLKLANKGRNEGWTWKAKNLIFIMKPPGGFFIELKTNTFNKYILLKKA